MFARTNRSLSLASSIFTLGTFALATSTLAAGTGGEIVIKVTSIESQKEGTATKAEMGETKATKPVLVEGKGENKEVTIDHEDPPIVDEAIPVCTADVNDDGLVTPDDLADFLTIYFGLDAGSGANADVNNDGLISPDDLDDFITSYFDGCEGFSG